MGTLTSALTVMFTGVYGGMGRPTCLVLERPNSWKTPDLRPRTNCLLFIASKCGFMLHDGIVKAGSADSLVSQRCVPSASVVSGVRLDPDCLRQGGGMFYFICSSVACWQPLPAHLDLVPDVWVPAIRWLNPPSISAGILWIIFHEDLLTAVLQLGKAELA